MTTDTTVSPATVATDAPSKYMTQDQALALVAKHGFTYTIQSGFIRVDGPKGNRIYIAATKTVRRVDISGFELPWEISQVPHCGPFGNVKQQLALHGKGVDAQLVALDAALQALSEQSPKVPAPKVKKVKTETAAPVVASSPADRLAELLKKQDIAEQMGAPLSASLIAEIDSLMAVGAQADGE